MNHCWHAASVQITTWRADEPRMYQCCHCGQLVSVTPTLQPTGHGMYAQEGERFQKKFTMPADECPAIPDEG